MIHNPDFELYERLPRAGAESARRPRNGYYSYHPDEFRVSYASTGGEFNIYLYDEIVSAEQFIPAIEALNHAGPSDEVIIHLSTPGGSMDATDTFLDALSRCKAGRIVTYASGGVHSAGTIILLNSDEFFLSPNFNALVHNASYGSGGKASDVRAQVAFTDKHVARVLTETYIGFLSKDEILALIRGQDFWFDADEFGARAIKRAEFFAEQIAQRQIEADEAPRAARPTRKRAKPVATTLSE